MIRKRSGIFFTCTHANDGALTLGDVPMTPSSPFSSIQYQSKKCHILLIIVQIDLNLVSEFSLETNTCRQNVYA